MDTVNLPPIGDYSATNPAPLEHPDLASWVWGLFEDSYAEKERLGIMARNATNYQLFRGNHWGSKGRNQQLASVNLFFANVMRTIANITAQNPVAEVVDLDGQYDLMDQVLTMYMKKWWNETEQQAVLCRSVQNCEIYGITVEKATWDPDKRQYLPVVLDGYSYFPAPGYYADNQEMPYQIHAYTMPVEQVEATYGVEGIEAEDVTTILGRQEREEARPNQVLSNTTSGVVLDTKKRKDQFSGGHSKGEALVLECWIWDFSTITVPTGESRNGEATTIEVPRYPDGIRVITICNRDVLLSDMANPNINLELEDEIKNTFAWGRIPFYYVNSYEDTSSIWGFSAGEQAGPLNKRINEIVSRMIQYCNKALFPTLIVEKGCGISKTMINNKPSLVLMPNRPGARIEYLDVPNLPSNFFNILDLLTSYHDRVWQIEDADRGVNPQGVRSASGLLQLQEKNAVLMRHKIRATEYLCRMRGRWNISFLQNFGIQEEMIVYGDEPVHFTGIDLVGRRFNYVIESDSTIAKTSIQRQEQALDLYREQAIDRQALLETLNFPGWRQITERVGEGQLDAALQILVEAGLEQEEAVQLKQYLAQPQRTVSGTHPPRQSSKTRKPKPGVPESHKE